MHVLSNEDIDGLLTMPECIAVMEEMYRDYANGQALLAPRIDSAEECVAGADVIAAATSSMVRVFEPAWIKPGVHLSCIKANEVDQELLDACDQIIVHVSAQPRQIDNIMPGTPNVQSDLGDGWWSAPGNRFADYKDLSQLVAGHASGRRNDSDVTCFVNSVGTGLQFAAAGALALEKAQAAGLGHELPDDWFSETVHA